MPTDAEFKIATDQVKSVAAEIKRWAPEVTEEVKRLGGVVGLLEERGAEFDRIKAAVTDIEQKMARRPGGGRTTGMGQYHYGASWGETFIKSDAFSAFVGNRQPGADVKGVTPRVEVKSITSSAGSGGALIAPDVRTDPVQLPQRPLTVRDLVSPGTTSSNTIWYPRQTTRANAAASVAENPSAAKPQSDYEWEQVRADVVTVAHWVPASKQVFDDAPGLASIIDSELRYGLLEQEERQLLMGSGTAGSLFGIMPQATAFDTTLFTQLGVQSPTAIDTLLCAVAQCETNLLPASGVICHPLDWAAIWAAKDTQNRYLVGSPGGDALQRFWSIPRVSTTIMPRGQFLVGAFRDGAQIFDRSPPTVLASTEDRDNFVKNMVTVLAEERLAFTVRRPNAFITGALKPPA